MPKDSKDQSVPAAQAEMETHSRRRHRRLSAEGVCVSVVPDGETSPPDIYLLNISISGAAILSHEPLGKSDDPVKVDILPNPERRPVRAVCQIRYLIGEQFPSTDGPRWLHGMQFVRPSPELTTFVDSYVRQQVALAWPAAKDGASG